MKKLIYYLIFLFSLIQFAFSNNFEITPIDLNLQDVIAKGDTIIALGNFGSILISDDNAANWKQARIFDRGTILMIGWTDIQMAAFNDAGDIAVSNDKGLTWNFNKNIGDSILSIIKYPEGYFIRGRNKLFTVSNNFLINKEFPFFTTTNLNFRAMNYRKSITYFNNNFIVDTDTSGILQFNNNLILLDSFSLNKLGFSVSSYETGYNLDTDSSYLYMEILGNYNKSYLTYDLDTVFRTKDFKNVEMVCNLKNLIYKIIINQFSIFNKNGKYLIDTTKETSRDFGIWLNNFTVINNKQIVVGNHKIIEIINLKDSSINVVSNFSGGSQVFAPDKIGNTSYLFWSGDYNYYRPYIFRTDDDGVTFKPVIEHHYDTSWFYNFSMWDFRFKYIDENENKIYLGGQYYGMGDEYLYISDDYCKNFTHQPINNYSFGLNPGSGQFINASSFPNLQYNNNNFIIADGYSIAFKTNKVTNDISTFNQDFIPISYLIANDIVIDYVNSKDTNTFLIHCENVIDSTSEIRYTNDHGNNWQIIKKFPRTESFSYLKEIENNNLMFLAITHYNVTEQSYRLDVVNLDNNKFDSLYKCKNYNNIPLWDKYGVCMDSDSGKVYISCYDTLFYITDLFDRNKWSYQLLPNHGRIWNKLMKKIGDKFYANYFDDNIQDYGYVFWLKPLDTITKVKDYKIEEDVDYLYAFPPYPIPGFNQISFHLYWDLCDDIDNDEINVYNMLGAKVAGREKFSINKASLYDGYLTWDCSDVQSGPYFIQIKRGNYSRTVKVIVAR